MTPQPVMPQGTALIEKARALGVPTDDLLTADGEEIAWKADRDFKAPINGVLLEFHKDEPIRDWPQIIELRKGRCPVSSLESELWRRVTMAQADKMASGDISPEAARRLGLSPAALKGLGVTSATTVEEDLKAFVDRFNRQEAVSPSSEEAPVTLPPAGALEPPRPDVITLRPAFMGMSIDLKELWRRSWPKAKSWLGKSA
jgi:hypothetical protein